MRVSVVIVSWNRKNDLRDTLRSVLSQNYPSLEIVVVDNCSTDGSPEMVKQDFPGVNLIQPERQLSACQSYNTAMKRSTGDIVVILDNDVVLGEDWIRQVVAELETDSQLGAMASRVVNFYTKEEIWGFGRFTKNEYFMKEFYCTTFIGCAAAIKNEILRQIGYYSEEFEIYVNEADLAARLLRAGYRIKYNPAIVAYHKVSPSQRGKGRKLFYSTRNFIWYYWEFYPFPQVLVASAVRIAVGLLEAVRTGLVRLYVRAVREAIAGLPRHISRRTPLKILKRTYSWKQLKEDYLVAYRS